MSFFGVVGWAKRSVPTIQWNAFDGWWARRKCAFVHPTVLLRSQRRGGREARCGDFLQWLQADLPRPVSVAKIICFAATPNHPYKSRHPVPKKRGVGHRHERWGGMRWTRQRQAREAVRRAVIRERTRRAGRTALKRTAKPCGPDTRGWCQAAGGEFDPTGSIEPSSRQRWRQDEFVSRESAA